MRSWSHAWSQLSFRVLIGATRELIYLVEGGSRLQGRSIATHDKLNGTLRVPSGDRHLAARMVEPSLPARAAILLLPGIGDRMEYWQEAQRYLADRRVASLIVHYSGYPASHGNTTAENLEDDAVAAHRWLSSHTGSGLPLYVLGFSLGSGIAAAAVGRLQPPPEGLILCEPYTSLRHAGRRIARAASALHILLPNLWRTIDSVGQIRVPVLIVHSDADRLFPLAMAEELLEAGCKGGAQVKLAVVHGHSHNAIYQTVAPDYWAEILNFLLDRRASGHG